MNTKETLQEKIAWLSRKIDSSQYKYNTGHKSRQALVRTEDIARYRTEIQELIQQASGDDATQLYNLYYQASALLLCLQLRCTNP